MYNIPKLEDKIKALYLYLDANRDDTEGDSWHYGHNPEIVSFVNELSAEESKLLCSSYLQWEEDLYIYLANPFLNITQPYIDGIYEYGKIFLQINDLENKEYLMQNLHVITGYTGKYTIEFLELILQDIKKTVETIKKDYTWTINQFEDQIKIEKSQ